jgi:hypothetical protein
MSVYRNRQPLSGKRQMRIRDVRLGIKQTLGFGIVIGTMAAAIGYMHAGSATAVVKILLLIPAETLP